MIIYAFYWTKTSNLLEQQSVDRHYWTKTSNSLEQQSVFEHIILILSHPVFALSP